MNKEIRYPYSHYLRWSENNTGHLTDILLSVIGEGVYIDPFELSTTTLLPLLKVYDKSSTVNYLSHIPLEYLREKYITDKIFIDDFEEKRYLLSKVTKESLVNEKFKGVPLEYFKKSVLDASINRNIDQGKIIGNDHLESDIGNSFEEYIPVADKSAWISNVDVNNILSRYVFLNPYLRVKNIDTIYIFDYKNIKSYFGKYIIEELTTNKHYDVIILPIIFLDHFRILILDRRLKTISFFDSVGFESQKIPSIPNVSSYVINSDLFAERIGKQLIINESENKNYSFISPIIKIILKSEIIERIIFNGYQHQRSYIECGPFIITFAMNYILLNPQKCIDIKNVYHSLFNKGDLTMSIFRSSLFVTKEDLYNFKMDKKKYDEYFGVLKIKNKFFEDYIRNHNEKILIFNKAVDQIIKSKKTFISNWVTTDVEYNDR